MKSTNSNLSKLYRKEKLFIGVATAALLISGNALANPSGGNIVAGSANITGQGTSNVVVNQTSNKAIIDWRNFSIGKGETTQFIQLSKDSIALNRVTGGDMSTILGSLTANGKVFVINPNGILFGKDAKIDVAGLIATSADISNENFMADGPLRFDIPGDVNAKIINQGRINISDAGVAAFVAPQVRNEGIITAQMGRVAFGGANKFTLDLAGDSLINFQLGDEITQSIQDANGDKSALVDIGGVIDARGGSILLTASAAREVVNQSVRVSGFTAADSAEANPDGTISLGTKLTAKNISIIADGEVEITKTASLDMSSAANGGNIGGNLNIDADSALIDGYIDLRGLLRGGKADINAENWAALGGEINASSTTTTAKSKGGTINISSNGGLSLASKIIANALTGTGGTINIHSEGRAIDNADSFIDATGINGGNIKYTSNRQIISSGIFRASGTYGKGGNIDITAPRISLFSSQIFAQGGIQGGQVRIGGEFQGGKNLAQDELANARTLVATDSTTIDVSAIGTRGNGGTAVLWSDNKTTFLGKVNAMGGTLAGIGGNIEISSSDSLYYNGTIETARGGARGGTLLLDPKNITIADGVSGTSISQYNLILQAFNSENLPGQATGLDANEQFGYSISLDGNRLAIGADQDRGAGNAVIHSGAVYLFTFADSAFSAPTLAATIGKGYAGGKNYNLSALEQSDFFGSSVSLDGNRLAVGARGDSGSGNMVAFSGAVYLFTFADAGFNTPILAATIGKGYIGGNNYDLNTLEAADNFGSAISLDGNRLAVGAVGNDGAGNLANSSGAVYLFTFADSSFSAPNLAATIGKGYVGSNNYDLSTLEATDQFGHSVSLDGNRLAVGASGDDGAGNAASFSGAVYLFTFADSAFSTPTLAATIGKGYTGGKNYNLTSLETNDQLGRSVSIDGNRLAIGALSDAGVGNVAPGSGAVYLFTFANSVFSTPSLAATIGKGYTGGNNYNLAALEGNDQFGTSVSLDGNRLAVGAAGDYGADNTAGQSGAVYLFTFADASFSTPNLAATIGKGYTGANNYNLSALESHDFFGTSVSMDGNRLAVGAYGDDGAGNVASGSGAVYLFTFADANFSTPTLAATIGKGYTGGKNYDLSALGVSDAFGVSVSLDGNRLAVGARDDGVGNVAGESGAVYLFTFADSAFSTPTLAATIGKGYTGSKNFNLSALDAFDNFGWSVSLNGNRLAVGARDDDGTGNGASNSGAVYLFTFADNAFSTPTLAAIIGKGYTGSNNYNLNNLEPGDTFGISVSLDGNRLAVGAFGDDGAGNAASNSGAVYLFTFADSVFSTPTLAATIGNGYAGANNYNLGTLVLDDQFGWSVSLDGNRLAVGANGDDGAGNTVSNSGAVYLFTFADSAFSTPTLAATIGKGYTVSNNYNLGALDANDEFGTSVSLDGNRLAVGATADRGTGNVETNSGAVYLFTFADSSFSAPTLVSTIGKGYSNGFSVPSTNGVDNNDRLGASVSLDGNRLAVGAFGDDGAGNISDVLGAVYLFTFADSNFSTPTLAAIIGKGYSGGKNYNLSALESGDAFGVSVSLNGNRLAVGASGDDGAGNAASFSGAVYLFTFADSAFSTPTLAATIGRGYTGSNNYNLSVLDSGDQFGSSVSLNGNRLAVGAIGDDGGATLASNSGAVYLFTFADSAFSAPSLAATIGRGYTGSNNYNLSVLDSSDQFGSSVSLNGNHLAVGAYTDDGAGFGSNNSGAVYIFTFADSVFSTATLAATIGKGYSGSNNYDLSALGIDDNFGSSVSLNGNRLAVGAIGDDGVDNLTSGSGAVYLFTFADSLFSTPTLTSTIGKGYIGANNYNLSLLDAFDNFGSSVSLDGNRLAVGAAGDDGAGNAATDSGAVYLFNLAGGSLGSNLYADNSGDDVTISPTSIANILNSGTALTLQANNDINVNSAITANNPTGNGGNLTLAAGRSIFINANITSDNGNVSIIANDDLANGVIDAHRDAGAAQILFGNNAGAPYTIDAGTGNVTINLRAGTGKTNKTSGQITLGNIIAGAISVNNEGETANSGVTIQSGAVLTASGLGNAIVLAGDNFINNAGASAINLTGGGRFLIYSNDWAADTRGGLTGNNLYNRTFGANGPSSITQTGNLFIFARQPTLTFTANNATREYGLVNPTFSATSAGLVNGDTAGYAFSGAPTLSTLAVTGSNVGSYEITAALGSLLSDVGYAFAFAPGTLTISKAMLTVNADDKTRQYGLANPTLTSTITGFRNSDTASVISNLALATSASIGSNVGSYAINASGGTATNYDFTYNPGTLTISKAMLTVNADDKTRQYGLANPTLTSTITGFRNSDTASVISNLALATSATTGSNVGTYAINASGGTATNYDFTYNPGTLTISKAMLTVNADDKTRQYGLANPTLTSTITGFRNSDTASVISNLALATSATTGSNVGTYAINASGGTATNYDFTYNPGTLTISKAMLTVNADDKTRQYGLANPTLTSTITGFRNSDTASVISNLALATSATTGSNVGTYAINASGGTATNYDFTYNPGTLTISKAMLTVNADDKTRQYGLANPTLTSTITGFRNSDTASVISNLALATSATTGSNVGSYAINASGGTATNYDFTYNPGTLTISKAMLTVNADDKTRQYGLANPTLTSTITGFRNSDTASVISNLALATSATTGSNVGTYAINASGGTATNYDFTYNPGTLTISKAMLTVNADDKTRQYGLANPTLTSTITGFRNSDTASVISNLALATSASIGSNVGSYAINASGGTATNYDFTYNPGTLTISKAMLTVNADDKTRQYGLANPTLTSTITGFRNSDTASVISNLALATSATTGSNVGTYAINASGGTATNYDFTYNPGTLTISKAMLTVNADDKTRQYGLANPTLTSTITGFRNSDTASVISNLALATSATTGSNVGSYAINASGGTATNYDFTYNPGTLTISKAMLTVNADDKTRQYGLANPTLTSTITGFRNSDTASVISNLALATSATTGSNVGSYAINASGGTATNYDFTYNPGTLTISKAMLTVNADDKTRQYGLANPTLTSTITGFRNSDTASVISNLALATSASIGSNVGSYAINASGGTATNYDFTYNPGTLTISKAMLTVNADDKTRQYGLANPTLTSTITGFRNSDTASVISNLALATSATTGSNVGSYAINASGGTATNYDFTYNPGTLTISKAMLTVNADDKTRQYGLANPTLTSTITGFRNSDTASVISNLALATSATTGSNVGTYAINASGGTATNYDFTYNPGTLTISKAMLTVNADDKTRQYGLANPTLTSTITGFRNSDTSSVISNLALATSATTGSNVGTYAINASGGTATNYDFTYNPGTLTISKAMLTVNADDKTRQYGLANPTLTSTITGFRNSDTSSVISNLALATSASIGSNVGTYAINASGGTATNYDFTYNPGTLTVTAGIGNLPVGPSAVGAVNDNAGNNNTAQNQSFGGTQSGTSENTSNQQGSSLVSFANEVSNGQTQDNEPLVKVDIDAAYVSQPAAAEKESK